MTQNFEQNVYSKNIQQLIIKTLIALVEEVKRLEMVDVSRYDMGEIRRFLGSSSWNPEIACKKIV